MILHKDFNLKNYNSYRLESSCAAAFFPESEEEILNFFKEKKSYVLLGSGNNVILSKPYYENDFLIFNGNFCQAYVNRESGIIEAETGITMLELSELALKNGLSGLEVFYDIPSSLGGAVVMNAGASGEEIKNVLYKVRYLDLQSLEVKEALKEDIHFEYRNSFFQKNTDKIVLKAWLQLKAEKHEVIKEKMEVTKEARWSKQPREFPNSGSVFKRPKGKFVGPMLDELGLKGYTIGGAQVSTKHSGFIVNVGGATGNNILSLIAHIQKEVKRKYEVELEVEQRIL